MNLLHLAIQGFKSFKKEQILDFRSMGFYLLSGSNQLNPDLGPNGCGKTSVWDALSWCFFGRTVRGVRASNVVNWEGSELCRVETDFVLDDGRKGFVSRTQSPNSLSIAFEGQEPKVVTQDELDDLFGWDYESFLNVCLMGQFNQFFFDLSPTEKLNTFSAALNIEYWSKKSDECRKKLASVTKERTDKANDVSKIEGAISSSQTHLADLQQKSREFADKKQEQLKQLNDKIGLQEGVIEGHLEQIKQKKEQISILAEKWEQVNKDLIAADEVVRKLQEEVAGLYATEQGHLRNLDKAKQEKSNLKEKVCSKCGTLLTPAGSQRQTEEADAKIKEMDDLHEKAWQASERKAAEKNEAAQELKKANALLDTIEREHKDRKRDLQGQEQLLNKARASYDQLLADEKRVKDEQDPYVRMIEDTQRNLGSDKDHLEREKQKLTDLESTCTSYETWAKLLKELRLWLIEDALKELEIEVNNALTSLGMSEWSVNFDIERESSTGGVSKGFSVFIRAPGHEPAPWESWSGGETQRLRIAGAIGLANLIRTRRGVSVNLEVWDEPTAHLSEEGVEDLVNFFQNRSRSEQRQVWIVDHRSLNYGSFDGEVNVAIDKTGSHFEVRG